MNNLPTVTDEFGTFDVEDFRLSLMERFKPDSVEVRLLDMLVGRIQFLEDEVEMRLRRCEIYASGLVGVVVAAECGEDTSHMYRLARSTLERIDR